MQEAISLVLKWLIWIMGAIVGISIIFLVTYFLILEKTLSLPPQALSEYIPAPSPTGSQTRSNLSSTKPKPFFYQSYPVKLLEGNFREIKLGTRFIIVTVEGKNRWFLLTDDTKLVCQPSGFLNVDTSSKQAIPANDVYIEDKRTGNFGIPWGVEFPQENIMARVSSGSPVRLFLDDSPGLTKLTATLRYVWFGECSRF